MRTIVFDVESTGTTRPQVCQLAYIIAGDEGLTARNYFFKVDAMNSYAYKVHRLSMSALKRLSGGQTFADRAGEISRDFYWADVYAGHGVSGDIDYLRREFARLELNFPERRRFCTMHYFTGRCGEAMLASGKPKPPRLSELWEHFGLSEDEISKFAAQTFGGGEGAHDARFDAAATYMSLKRAAEAGQLPHGIL
jgi:DNA polymerase-3 subunit epsilon